MSKSLFVSFNQDSSCFAVGTCNGFKIFKCQPFGECFYQSDGGIGIVEMLFNTSLIALVGAGDQPILSPRKLRLWNTATGSVASELNFLTSILAVRMNRKRMVVVLENKVHIFELAQLKFLHSLDTTSNPKGISAFSSNQENCYLAIPGDHPGSVQIFDALGLHLLSVIDAHTSKIGHLAFDRTGTLLATASEKGTVIRVYSIPDMTRIHSFRRGSTATTIHSMTFSEQSNLLCVSSASPTIHIFKLEDTFARKGSVSSASEGSLQYSLQAIGVPSMLTSMLESSRHFAFIKLQVQPQRIICSFTSDNTITVVTCADGIMHRYVLDPQVGGECRLENEFRLDAPPVEQSKFVM
eukprot:c6901_g1_i1.p1 GENE.c6901_g1_i1~~c6901_g1_i1.p1  ORF type:complete len:362 (+),score=42.44 c6901_g1_i1:30-1088(+)